ncbi:MAG TPA: SDR family oxidoreductase [Candidatus Dormibacteraeota bacterium]|nr:SDR family oxidoreductase [Candidatus Dormibacteraeota bacterium]
MPNAVVTGASRRQGIAAAVAERLRADGWTVFTTGWREYDAKMSWGADSEQHVDLELDLSEPRAAAVLMDAAEAPHGTVSGLVVAHTVDIAEPLTSLSADSIDRHLAVNVRGTLLLMKEFAARVDKVDGGRIVLITSGLAHPGSIAYAASKSAMRGIVATAAEELAPLNITVNAVDPGPTQTGWMDAEAEQRIAETMPRRRVNQPSDVAELVTELMSPTAHSTTGQFLAI